MPTQSDVKPLRVGIAGLGMAGNLIVSSLVVQPGIELVAASDLRDHALNAFQERYGGVGHESFEDLCSNPDVDAVWLATPTHLHCEQAVALAEHGKHVVVEKPMAVTLDECERMIDAAERNGVTLIAGGSRSFDPAFTEMRQIISSGRLGALKALSTWCFTTWMLRPREPHEVDAALGGGAIYNQAPHSVDVLRLLGGGMIRSVRAMTAEWMPSRNCPGFFTAMLEFENGMPASVVYDGHGYVSGWEFLPWGETPARLGSMQTNYAYRRQLNGGVANEIADRERFRFAGTVGAGPFQREDTWNPGDAGIVQAFCETGHIRQSAQGLYVYDDEGRRDEPLPSGGDFRANEVAELLGGVTGRARPIHDGRWGMATMEVVLAIMDSAKQGRDVKLSHQRPVADDVTA